MWRYEIGVFWRFFSVFPKCPKFENWRFLSVFPKFLWHYVALCGAMNSVFFGVFPFFRNFCGAVALCGAMKSVFFGVFSVFPKFPKFDKLVFFGVFPFFRNFCGTMWRYVALWNRCFLAFFPFFRNFRNLINWCFLAFFRFSEISVALYVALCGAMKSVIFCVFSVFPKFPKCENGCFFRFSVFPKFLWRYAWRPTLFSKWLARLACLRNLVKVRLKHSKVRL